MVLDNLWTNNVFWAILISVVVSQGLKVLLIIFRRRKKFKLEDMAVTGGMPSSHSALVSAVVLIILINEGTSTLFFVSAVLGAIVIRDALGVRRTAGEEGKILNLVIKKAKLKIPKLKYSLGHTPKQVFVGIIIGLISAAIAYFIFA